MEVFCLFFLNDDEQKEVDPAVNYYSEESIAWVLSKTCN